VLDVMFCFMVVGLFTSVIDALSMKGVPAPEGKEIALKSLSLKSMLSWLSE
jgi:hypothetical protein